MDLVASHRTETIGLEVWEDQIGGWLIISEEYHTHQEAVEDMGRRFTESQNEGYTPRYRIVESRSIEYDPMRVWDKVNPD